MGEGHGERKDDGADDDQVDIHEHSFHCQREKAILPRRRADEKWPVAMVIIKRIDSVLRGCATPIGSRLAR
jgi:hypothetical protein